MSNPYLGFVNRQLILARHQLSLRLEEKNASDKLRNEGLIEAALWHLGRAYRAYIAEVAANYKVPKPELPKDAKELSESLQAINKHPAEAQELERLASEGFISSLMSALIGMQTVQAGLFAPAPTETQNPLNIIDITELSEPLDLSFELLTEWVNAFKELIDRHREHMIEY